MKLLSDKVLGCVFGGWLVLFWLSYWLGNPVPAVVGNRTLASFPDQAVTPFSSAWLQKVSAWAIDHSPFRLRTIVERNGLLVQVAQASQPVPVAPGSGEVAMGRDGWLFIVNEVPDKPTLRLVEDEVTHALAIAREVTASGRRFILMPVPDKSSVYPDYSGTLMHWADDRRLRELSWTRLDKGFTEAADVRACYLPLWTAYADTRKMGNDLLYWPHDTHWNQTGMLVALPRLLERLQPGLWEPQAVQPDGVTEAAGDLLFSFLLQPTPKTAKKYRIARPEPVKEEHLVRGFAAGAVTHYQSTDPRAFRGRTLVMSDSFMEAAEPLFAPWFEDVTFAHFNCTGSQELADQISRCDTLVFTTVERTLAWKMAMWATHQHEYVHKALTSHVKAP